MKKVYVCYMISKGLDDSTNILSAFDTFEKAVSRNRRAYNNILCNEKTIGSDFDEFTGTGHIYFEYNGSVTFKVKALNLNFDVTLN